MPEETKTAAQIQSEHDRAEIKIKVIENGLLLKTGDGWFAFEEDEKAFESVRARIKALRQKRGIDEDTRAIKAANRKRAAEGF